MMEARDTGFMMDVSEAYATHKSPGSVRTSHKRTRVIAGHSHGREPSKRRPGFTPKRRGAVREINTNAKSQRRTHVRETLAIGTAGTKKGKSRIGTSAEAEFKV